VSACFGAIAPACLNGALLPGSFRELMKAATPDRIDVYFDNTGGDILQTCLFRMATRGRICCCGNVSQYDTATPGGGET